ncbi:MAG: 30S ribosomal protein S3ae [Methanophagales archaeon]|nr:30S ribosomal protein S3ae [Methanophagales archaeon]
MAKKKLKDKWRAKEWYTVLAPEMFGDVKAGETVADSPEKLIGRRVEMTVDELTGRLIKNTNLKLVLEIDEVDHNKAHTRFIGHKVDGDYLRSLARKRSSKVDSNIDVVTKDGENLRVKSSSFTLKKASESQIRQIRKIMEEVIRSRAGSLELNKYLHEIILGKLSSDIYKVAKKVYSVRRVEITKTERAVATAIAPGA